MDFKQKAVDNKILEIRIGSHLFGTETPESDLDMYGIFMPFDEIIYGSYTCEDVKFDVIAKDQTGRNTSEAVDHTLCEYRKYVKLAMQNNPNILNALFVNEPNIIFVNDFGKRLLEKAEIFPHKGCFERFIKYADSQRHKMLIKQENFTDLQEAIKVLADKPKHNILYEFKDLKPFSYNEGRHIKVGDLHIDISVDVAKAISIIEGRIAKATNRTELYTKYGYDVKYASNLIQLLYEGLELLKTGRLQFPLAYKDEILKIKRGEYKPDQIFKWADEIADEARAEFLITKLPEGPRTKEIETFAMAEVKRYCNEE